MSTTEVRAYLEGFNKADKIKKIRVPVTSVEETADCLGIMPSRLVKHTAFLNKKGDGCIMIISSGDAIVDKVRYKTKFRYIPDELNEEQTIAYTGYSIADLCPFAVIEEYTRIYLDKSLKRFDYVYVKAGDDYTIVKLTCEELFECTKAVDWVEMGRTW